jgi:hypothetical protein
MVVDELLTYLFDDPAHFLAASLAAWMTASPRFTAFVATYRDKIRKKIRGMRDAEGLRDLLLELETAYLLLQERRFAVAYEPYGKGKARSPDFSVTFRTRVTFNVEVTRMRVSNRSQRLNAEAISADHNAAEQPLFDMEHESSRLADIVCGKLGQMLPNMINLLVIIADSSAACDLDVGEAMRRLKTRAESNDTSLFTRNGFYDTSDFFKHYQRLSGVLMRSAVDHEAAGCPVLWANNQAKRPLPRDVRVLLQK